MKKFDPISVLRFDGFVLHKNGRRDFCTASFREKFGMNRFIRCGANISRYKFWSRQRFCDSSQNLWESINIIVLFNILSIHFWHLEAIRDFGSLVFDFIRWYLMIIRTIDHYRWIFVRWCCEVAAKRSPALRHQSHHSGWPSHQLQVKISTDSPCLSISQNYRFFCHFYNSIPQGILA